MNSVILCDNQDITRIGMDALCKQNRVGLVAVAKGIRSLVQELLKQPESVVVLDYPSFDFADVELLLVTASRFPKTRWILFSENLNDLLIHRLIMDENVFSIVMKDDSLKEIQECLLRTLGGERYVCQRITDMLLRQPVKREAVKPELTPTEIEILKSIALGKTTKVIAKERCSSINTIITHRKNIFRKLDVNNVHEATKYAFRTGIVDAAEYFI